MDPSMQDQVDNVTGVDTYGSPPFLPTSAILHLRGSHQQSNHAFRRSAASVAREVLSLNRAMDAFRDILISLLVVAACIVSTPVALMLKPRGRLGQQYRIAFILLQLLLQGAVNLYQTLLNAGRLPAAMPTLNPDNAYAEGDHTVQPLPVYTGPLEIHPHLLF